jgi:hypothetical protein
MDVVRLLPSLRLGGGRDTAVVSQEAIASLAAEHLTTGLAADEMNVPNTGTLPNVLSVFMAARQKGVQSVLIKPGVGSSLWGQPPMLLRVSNPA